MHILPPCPLLRCLSPPSMAAGVAFDVFLVAAGVPTTYGGGRWTVDNPVVTSVSPPLLSPHTPPLAATNITIHGANFGWVAGVVTAGWRVLECGTWTNTLVVCTAPPGAGAEVPLVVAAATRARSPTSTAAVLRFAAPVVTGGALVPASPAPSNDSATTSTSTSTTVNGSTTLVSITQGGGLLRVAAASLGHPLPVSAWLVYGPGALSPPWWDANACVPVEGASAQLPCPLLPGSVSPSGLTCVLPPGRGTGWRLVLVNHDPDPAGPAVDYTVSVAALGGGQAL